MSAAAGQPQRFLLTLNPNFSEGSDGKPHQEPLSNASESAHMACTLEDLGYVHTPLARDIKTAKIVDAVYNILSENPTGLVVLYISSHGIHVADSSAGHLSEDTEVALNCPLEVFTAGNFYAELAAKFGAVSQVPGNLCVIYDVCQGGISNIFHAPKVPCDFLRISASSSSESAYTKVFVEGFRKYVWEHDDQWDEDSNEGETLRNYFDGDQSSEILCAPQNGANVTLMKNFFGKSTAKDPPPLEFKVCARTAARALEDEKWFPKK